MPIDALTERVTRYEAYVELRELWDNGVETIDRIQPQYLGKGDEIKRKLLKAAIELLDARILQLSKFDMAKFDLRRTIDGIPASAESIELGAREEVAREWRQNQRAAVPDGKPSDGSAGGTGSGRDAFS